MKRLDAAALAALLIAVGCSAADRTSDTDPSSVAASDLSVTAAASTITPATTVVSSASGTSADVTGTVTPSVALSDGGTCTVPAIDARRSLEITDVPILSSVGSTGAPRFSLFRVLSQLLTTAQAPSSETPLELYERIFDTNNTRALGSFSNGQHCDDQTDTFGRPAIAGSAIDCPRQEGSLSGPRHVPFVGGSSGDACNPQDLADCDPYSPLAIINRFDLAPPGGANCGQYRIIFGKGLNGLPPVVANADGSFTFHAPTTLDRNLIIFEAVVPNPSPSCGIRACAPLQQAFASLSTITDPQQRAAELETLWFTGLPGFGPVINAANFVASTGQIRANQFMNAAPNTPVTGQGWQLREYKLDFTLGSALHVDLVPVKSNPFAELFVPDGLQADGGAVTDSDPRLPAFQSSAQQNLASFAAAIPGLALTTSNDITTLNSFFFPVTSPYNGGQSTSLPSHFFSPAQLSNDVQTFVEQGDDSEYTKAFTDNSQQDFLATVQGELTLLKSKLTPRQVINRALTQACAGCHELSSNGPSDNPEAGVALDNADVGLTTPWPQSLGFVQVSEQNIESCESEFCWEISPALKNVLLPFRASNMKTFLKAVDCNPVACSTSATPAPAGAVAFASDGTLVPAPGVTSVPGTPTEVITLSVGNRSE